MIGASRERDARFGRRGGPLRWRWLGRVDYADAVARMETLRTRILDGDEGAATLLLCEHAPVITLGRRARAEHLLATAEALAARGVAVERSSRGGDVTYHGPGQLVAYPVLRLDDGLLAHMTRLCGAAVDLVADFGVAASFDRARPGVWADGGKLAAVGVHVHRRVAIHGLALNVTTALDAFNLIVPCGLRGVKVTSIAALSGAHPGLPSLAARFADAFARRSGRTAEPATADEGGLQLDRPSVE
jgi:lipoate-protein ligase B